MNNNQPYSEFTERFAAPTLQSLIDSFNSQVGNRGIGSARAAHDAALIKELRNRGIDLSAVTTKDGAAVTFTRKVSLNEAGNALIAIGDYMPGFSVYLAD